MKVVKKIGKICLVWWISLFLPGILTGSAGNGFWQTSKAFASEAPALSWIPSPEQMITGLYDWDGKFLVSYYNGSRFGLCLVDMQTGEVYARLEGFEQELQMELCQDNLPEMARTGDASPLLEFFKNDDTLLTQDEGINELFNEDDREDEPGQLLRIFDRENSMFQWLDKDLKVVGEYFLDAACASGPLMDPQNRYIYYVTSDGQVIQLDWQSGESQALNAGGPFAVAPYLEGIYNEGKILAVSGMVLEGDSELEYENYVSYKNYVDVANNRLLEKSQVFSVLNGSGSNYYTTLYGTLNQAVFGTFSAVERCVEFIFPDYEEYEGVFAWPREERLMTCYTMEEISGASQTVFSLYDMDSGKMVSQTMEDFGDETDSRLRLVLAGYFPETETAVFTLSGFSDRIFVWKAENAPISDQSFKVPFMAADGEDAAAFEALTRQAQALEQRFDVEILLGDACPSQIWGYDTQPLYSVPKIRRALMFLESSLEKYPEGFFSQLTRPDGSRLSFYIVSRLVPDGQDSISSSIGLFGGSDGNYIALGGDSMGNLQTLVYHEVSHAIDYKLSGNVDQNYMDSAWSALNPQGFYYSWSYQANAADPSWDYVYSAFDNSQEAYFIDKYSKSFPTEDRARVMEYAMGMYPGSGYFTSSHLLEKLEYISWAIRAGFDTQGWPETVWWERPLNAS